MNDKAKAAYNVMATKMDKDHDYKCKLREYYIKHGSVPEDHKEAFAALKRDRFKSWRTMPKVVKRIKRSSKRAARNE